MHAFQRDIRDNVDRNQAELRELVLQFLRQGRETQAIELQDAGPQVAQRVMEVGQEVFLLLALN